MAEVFCQRRLAYLGGHQTGSRPVELFFFPLPAVQEFRDLFQARIGWLP